MTKLYLVGSLRNERIPELAKKLRKEMPDIEVFDDWYAAGREADDYWKKYEQDRGRTYEEALEGHAAKHVFAFDKHHLDTSTHVLLVLPAGKSGHMEVVYGKYGAGAQTAILLEPEFDGRYDVMYQFVDKICTGEKDVVEWINRTTKPSIDYANIGKGDANARCDELIARGGFLEGRVPHGGRAAGLLSERSGGDSPALKTGGGQASSGGASALGEVEKYRSPEQDSQAFDRLGQSRRARESTYHWLGVEGSSVTSGGARV